MRANPGGYVAKNLLRPRTGSNQNQDRKATGGVIVQDAHELERLVADEELRER